MALTPEQRRKMEGLLAKQRAGTLKDAGAARLARMQERLGQPATGGPQQGAPTNQKLNLRAIPRKLRRTIRGGLRLGDVLEDRVGLGGEDPLGRIDAGRSALMKEIIERRRAGLEGLTAPENTALREAATSELDRTMAGNLRNLAMIQGRSGVRGAAAGAQFSDLGRQRMDAQRALERDIMLQNVAEKQRRLAALEGTVGRAEAFERAGEAFNLGQLAKEIAARSATQFGGIGALSTLKTGQEARRLQEQAIAASQAANERLFGIQEAGLNLQAQLGQEALAIQREQLGL